jgi:RimJ/RimL family protein N-acetyltransferase
MIETERLVMRPFEEADVEEAFRWFGDPEVMRFIVSGVHASRERTRAWIVEYRAHQLRHGFSKWAIVERESGRLIGDSGLVSLPGFGIELGYRLARPWWGRGLATEAASAWVRAAFEVHRLERIGAFAHPEHAASHRVLAKLGFRFEERRAVLGMDALVFALDRPGARAQ